ncbi:TIGR03986 family type III CRISPR-associated RAMP protein [Emticicia fluvialis]|uniref:TIGR03986 family type III CRISPR-associated RAMP protein n=1 Tax=Emticicia fluvialis TaxID=2974474 RepID=UPI00216636B8|nr:TIGR03986 family CRISPR-associated RAMP protein [Emticicia fluvialis]
MVKSPYNFVPAPEEGEVFTPEWAALVSHDVPFEDGESGEITVKITAETPIFIRNGHAEGKDENEFCHVGDGENKKYFIPGSSIKGMLRNVLEIMSFSRMKQVADDRYAFRDLTRNSLYMRSYKSQEVKAGWLHQLSNGDWRIEECESMAFISHVELAKAPFNMGFRNEFLNKSPADKSKNAVYKYQKIENQSLNYSFRVIIDRRNSNKPTAEFDEIGIQGTLVFTGQSGKRQEDGKRHSGKINEFVFFDNPNPTMIDVSEKQIKDFKFIYLDHDSKNISTDWEFWKSKLENNQRIPIFYSKDSQGKLKHFGLAFMYKLPFEYSIHEIKPIAGYNKGGVDLAELIFGYSKNKESLKGRVMISHAFSENAVPLELRREIFGSPKASYYPFYLKQFKTAHDGKTEYYTYQNNESSLRGYKRYPTQKGIPTGLFDARYSEEQRKNFTVFSSFIPLKEGTEFTCKIRFHNLKKAEIGALISSLTFHGDTNQYSHSLGAAKPFGYGKVKVKIVKYQDLKFDASEYLKSFEDLIGEDKLFSEPVRQLLAMASANENLSYPKLEEFVTIKNNEETISNYSTSHINAISITRKLQKEKKREELSMDYDLSGILSFRELRNKIKADFEDEVPAGIKQAIYECIKRVFDEKETKKAFRDKKILDNPWQLPISIWLGPEQAKALYDELTKP